MLFRDPFDIAPLAPRHTLTAWLVLAVGVVFAAFAGAQLLAGLQSAGSAADDVSVLRQALRAEAKRQSVRASEAPHETAENVRARLQLQRALNLSWSELFAILEGAAQAVEGRATITALAPVRLRPEGAELSLTAVAVSPVVMLQYLRALEGQPGTRQVQLTAQQPATMGGVDVVRFQASLLLDRTNTVLWRAPDHTVSGAGGGQ